MQIEQKLNVLGILTFLTLPGGSTLLVLLICANLGIIGFIGKNAGMPATTDSLSVLWTVASIMFAIGSLALMSLLRHRKMPPRRIF